MNITKCKECGCTKMAEDGVAILERQLAEARKEARHWKANHDQQVAFKRVTAQKRDEFKAKRDRAIQLLQNSTILIHSFDMLTVEPYWKHRDGCGTCAIESFLAGLEEQVPWCQGHAEGVEHVEGKYPTRRGKCSLCGREGPVNDSGRTFRHRRAAKDRNCTCEGVPPPQPCGPYCEYPYTDCCGTTAACCRNGESERWIGEVKEKPAH